FFIRYSRADLLSLRYDGKSRQRPQCSNRVELQTLHFWKVNLNAVASSSSSSLASCINYANQSKNRLSPETDNSSLNSSNNGSISSRRAMRNRERANNYYQRFIPTVGGEPLPICGEEREKSFKSPPIDHRSISSSHLMPAFAKRRFAAVNGGSGNGNEATQNTCDDLNGPELSDRVASPQLTKNSTTPAAGSSQTWKLSGSDYENPGAAETESRLNYVQVDPQVPQCSSPTFSSRLERQRIGSGRLLVNSWEYNKSQKAKESSLDIEKETSFNGSNRHRTYSGRITENIDRRFQYDNNKRHTDNRQNIASIRRNNNKEALNNRSKRLNTYHHNRNEEPEWFSAGPTSQLETIDLHGFDELENNENDDKEYEEEVNNKKKPLCENNKEKNLAVMREADAASSSEDKKDTKEKQNKNQSNSDTQFNFDAFLNMHPLDPTLLTNDDLDKDEIKGTSRFSRWFLGKDATNNAEPPPYHEPLHIQEKHGIPSVKDLEAQMTKVDMRSSDFQGADEQRAPLVPVLFPQTMPTEKPVARDTEAFKKLLQQLGGSQILPQVRRQPLNQCANDGSFHLINNLSPELPVEPIRKTDHRVPQQLHLLNNTATVHEFEIKRMEMQQLMQNLNRGDISVELLEKELHNPNTPPHSKEVIATAIREYRQHTKRNPAAVVHSDSHLVVSHHSTFPRHEVHPNPGNHHGINQQLNSVHSHGHNSQTPLAFTPTSVLRKMTADKDATSQIQNSSHNQHLNQQYQLNPQYVKQQEQPILAVQQQQPRMILGGGGNFALGPNPQQQCRSNQNQILKWNSGVTNMHIMHGKSFGRPILKGSPNSLSQIQIPAVVSLNQKMELQQHIPQHQQMHQQQQQLRFKTSVESNLNLESLHQNVNVPDGFPQHNFQQQHNLLMHHQQQQRQALRPRVIYGELHQQQHHHQPSGFHDICGDSGNVVKNNSCHRDERMPTPPPSNNNQLAQWFSPELLAKASAGKLPHLNQSQALSLEEFERSIQHSSAVVHN
ncbi:hypothetical protein KR054_002011, partial [Drosophila jambulina]